MSISYEVYSSSKMQPTLALEKVSREFNWVVGPDSMLLAPGLVMWFRELQTRFLKEMGFDDYGVDGVLSICLDVERGNERLGQRNMLRTVLYVLSMDASDTLFKMEEVPLLVCLGGQLTRFKHVFWREELVSMLPPHEIQENPVACDW